MATIDHTRPAPFGAITALNVVNRIEGVFATIGRWNAARATARSLNGLSDHELDDIGLTRGDIDRIAGRY